MEENIIIYFTGAISFMFDCKTQYGSNIYGTDNLAMGYTLIGL